MTHQQLRELCEKATPGPWTVDPIIHRSDGSQMMFPRLRFWGTPDEQHGHGSVCINECRGNLGVHNATAAFIAAARTAVPALLDENDALRAALREALEIAKRLNFQRGLIGATADYRARLKRTAETDLARISELRSHLDER